RRRRFRPVSAAVAVARVHVVVAGPRERSPRLPPPSRRDAEARSRRFRWRKHFWYRADRRAGASLDPGTLDCSRLRSGPVTGEDAAMQNAEEALRRVTLFSDLSGRQLRKLAAHLKERRFEPGTTVVREGQMSGI